MEKDMRELFDALELNRKPEISREEKRDKFIEEFEKVIKEVERNERICANAQEQSSSSI